MTEEKRARHRRYTLSKRILGPAREHHRLITSPSAWSPSRPSSFRGRFCHFKSMGDLVDRVTEQITGNGSIFAEHAQPRCGIVDSQRLRSVHQHDMERSALLIKQGGMDSFSGKVKRLMFGAGKAILCIEGKEGFPGASRPVHSTSSPNPPDVTSTSSENGSPSLHRHNAQRRGAARRRRARRQPWFIQQSNAADHNRIHRKNASNPQG